MTWCRSTVDAIAKESPARRHAAAIGEYVRVARKNRAHLVFPLRAFADARIPGIASNAGT